jgi:hypothetical protein
VDWAQVALAVGPAAVAGSVGYFGARLQAATAIHQATMETKRLGIGFQEEERRNRQGTYHQFLAVLARHDMMLTGYDLLTPDSYRGWVGEFYFLRAGMDLFGTLAVRDAMGPLTDVLGTIGQEVMDGDKERPFLDRLIEAYERHREDAHRAEVILTEAMRADVGRNPAKDDTSK